MEKEIVDGLEELKDRKLSKGDLELLYKGIRPTWMPQIIYKRLRKDSNLKVKAYLKGKFLHVSSWTEFIDLEKDKVPYDLQETADKGERIPVKKTATYRKRRVAQKMSNN